MVNVIVISSSGAITVSAELDLKTGIIKYPGFPSEYSTLTAELSAGKIVKGIETEARLVAQEYAEEPVVAVVENPSPVRNEEIKPKKKKR